MSLNNVNDGYRRDIACLRKDKLVYARTLKAGSEFFYKNFQDASWAEVPFDSIDWHNETVFSYIMDPIQRRHKGISEIIIATGTYNLVLSNKKNIGKLVRMIPFLDAHSASLHNIYGPHVRKIHWLLMTTDHSVAIKETERFLTQHSVSVPEWKVEYTHATDSYMNEIYTCVKSLWESNDQEQHSDFAEPTVDDTVRNYFQPDIDLYREIKAQYERNYGSQHS